MKIKDVGAAIVFEPVTLEITFESLKEVQVFYGMIGGSIENILKVADGEHGIDRENISIDDTSDVQDPIYDWVDGQLAKYD
jgi:hypothetical protein